MISPALSSNNNPNNNLHQQLQRLDHFQQLQPPNEYYYHQQHQHQQTLLPPPPQPQQQQQPTTLAGAGAATTSAPTATTVTTTTNNNNTTTMDMDFYSDAILKHENGDSIMEADNIDENMTVPHPSRQPTTNPATPNNNNTNNTTLGLASNHAGQIYANAAGMHLQQPYHHQHHHHHHHHQQQQQQQQHHQQQQQQQCLQMAQQHYSQQQSQYQYKQQQHPNHLHEQQHQYQSPPPQQQPQQQQQQQQAMNEKVLHDPIKDRLSMIVQKCQELDDRLKESNQAEEEFMCQFQERNKLHSTIDYLEAQPIHDVASLAKAKSDLKEGNRVLKIRANELNHDRVKLFADLKDLYEELRVIQHSVIEEHLARWHHEQQLASNNYKIENNSHVLDQIQAWVERITDITWRIKNLLKAFHLLVTRTSIKFDVDELNRFALWINRSLETLILKTFVVEKQPPQVMKTNTRFTSTVRFLSGAKLNVQMINPTVRVTILSESNARGIIQRHQEIIQTSWSVLDYPSSSSSGVAQQQSQPPPHVISSPSPAPSSVHSTSSSGQPQQQQQQQAYISYSSLSCDEQQLQSAPPSNGAPAPTPPSHCQQGGTTTPSPQPQQQIFQQLHPPQQQQQQQQQQFHVQSPPAPSHHHNMAQYSHAHPNFVAYYSQKILNMNEFDPSGEILNNSNILEYQENTGQLVCNFRNMQLKKIKRTEKKGTESVMDEKFVLLFHAEFRIAESGALYADQQDLAFHIMAFSLPVVVIVHGNQEPHAWATVTWHNAFARPDSILYQVPDKVAWRDLGHVLSEKFRSCAGKGLSAQNLDYLASKVCRARVDRKDALVTWNQFAKESLPERSFTFWEWFHSILKLTREHLRDLWNAGRIYGFVGKKGCIDLLLGSAYHEPTPVGTFLMRYSETELGGITIAWSGSGSASSPANKALGGCVQIMRRTSQANSPSNVLMHLQPFVSKDLNTRSLADRIRDLEDLVYLYPDIPKDDAFGAYYTPLNDTAPLPNDYIRPMLVTTLPNKYPKSATASSTDGTLTTPATPNSFSQNSPKGVYQESAFMSEMDPGSYPVAYGPPCSE